MCVLGTGDYCLLIDNCVEDVEDERRTMAIGDQESDFRMEQHHRYHVAYTLILLTDDSRRKLVRSGELETLC